MQGADEQLLHPGPIKKGFWSRPSMLVLIAFSYAFGGASMAYLLNMIYFFDEEEKKKVKFNTLEVAYWVTGTYVLRVIVGLVFDYFPGSHTKKFWCFLAAVCISFLCYAYDILVYYEMVGDTLLYFTFALNLPAQALIEVLTDSFIVVESKATRDRGSQLMVLAWIFSNIFFNASFLLSYAETWLSVYLAIGSLPILFIANCYYSWKSTLNSSGISCSVLWSIVSNKVICQSLIVVMITAFCFEMRFSEESNDFYLQLVILGIDVLLVVAYLFLSRLHYFYFLSSGIAGSVVLLLVALFIHLVFEPYMTGLLANSGVGSIAFGLVTLPYLVFCTRNCQVGYEVSSFSFYKFFPNLGILISILIAECVKGIAEEEWQILIKIGLLVIPFVFICVFKEKMSIQPTN